MKKYQIACIIVLGAVLSSCVTNKVYAEQRALLFGYQQAYDRVKVENDELNRSIDSLILAVDSLQVELENR